VDTDSLLSSLHRGCGKCLSVIDTLFALFEDGDIVKVDTLTNPCTVEAHWSCDNMHSQQLSLLISVTYLLITSVTCDVILKHNCKHK